MTSATPSATPTHTQQASAPPAPATASTPPSSAPKPKPTKPKQRRGKPVKRRGAKMEEDEEQSEDVALQAAPPADASDSDSDFSVGGPPDEDDEDEDEDDSEAEGAADPKTPATASTEQLAANTKGGAKALLDGSPAHPSWSEMPAAGEMGSEDLPTLDFASLTPGTLAAVPAAPATKPPPPGRKPSATPSDKAGAATDRANKREQVLAKREAKSAELKAKDPAAWEAQEKERKERELARKKEKNLRAKEKKREKKLAEQQQTSAEASAPAAISTTKEAAPSASTSKPRLPTGPRASAQPKPTRPPVPSRPSRTAVQLGLANTGSSTSSPAPSTSAPTSSAPASRPPPSSSRAPPTGPAASRAPPPHQGPSADYVQAREAYSTRLANDPSYIPRVGKFWSHDDRLASPEVRPLVWRGRGGRGGERGAYVGRGRGRGAARGGARGTEGWTGTGGWEQPGEPEEKKVEEEKPVVEEPKQEEAKAEKSGDDTEDDGWGRGEAKKLRNASTTPSSFASVPAWSHDGFDELQEDRPPSTNGRGRGGFRGRGGRGGWIGSLSHDANGRPIPGAVNPRYANLPFHPQHRFPLAPHAPPPAVVVADAPTPEDQTTSRPVAGEASLFDESSAVGVRLPGSGAPPAPVELAIKGTAALSLEESTQTEPAQAPPAVQASAEQPPRRPSASTGVLYSAVPARLPSDDQAPPPPLPSQPTYAPPPHLAHHYQLPPHLQPQGPPPPFPSQAPPPGQFIPRHASPAFYPPQHHAYYSPDAFPSMPTPGATPPPPPLYPLGPGGQPQAFFAPPRNSKIEIKAPGSGTILSAGGDAFSPRPSAAGQPPFAMPPPPHHQQRQPQYSPISSRDGMGTPGSPQMMHQQRQQQQQMHHMAQQYGGYAPSPYEYEQQGQGGAGPDGSYVPVENGGIVYFVKSPNAPRQPYYSHQPQNPYYDPYAQQQGGGGYGGAQHQHQDPAILMSSGGGYGQQGGQESQQYHGEGYY